VKLNWRINQFRALKLNIWQYSLGTLTADEKTMDLWRRYTKAKFTVTGLESATKPGSGYWR